MEKINGNIQVHCCFSLGDKCDYAEMKNGECVYNNTEDMVCTSDDVREELLKHKAVNAAESCRNCVNWNADGKMFSIDCYSCSRYQADLFERRKPA